jgi:Leucine-rich repeat (LRR) protein
MNQLKELPKEIGSLQNLQILDLSGNQLETLPREIGKLKKLRKLLLGGNKLKEFPKEIIVLKELIKIDISRNPFLINNNDSNLENIKKGNPDIIIKY